MNNMSEKIGLFLSEGDNFWVATSEREYIRCANQKDVQDLIHISEIINITNDEKIELKIENKWYNITIV